MPASSQPLDDLREIAVLLNQLSEEVHQMTHQLELAVEGPYASEFADPRVQLLTDALRVVHNGNFRLAQIYGKLGQLERKLEGREPG